MAFSRILFVVNPTAGAGSSGDKWRRFKAEFQNTGISFDECTSSAPGAAIRLAADNADKYEAMVAVGGDGLAFEVATGLLRSANRACALGVVPTGTGNDIATTLGIREPAAAAQALKNGHCLPMDVLQLDCVANGNTARFYALLFAGVGLAAECLKKTTPTVKRICGEKLAYPVGLIRALWSHDAPRLRVQCDGQTEEGRFLFIGASNTESAGGGMKLAPGARVADGLLNMTFVKALGPWRALLQVRRLCRGQHIHHPHVRYFTGTNIEISSDRPVEVAADGELVGHTPARFQVLPQALKVVTLGTPPGWFPDAD